MNDVVEITYPEGTAEATPVITARIWQAARKPPSQFAGTNEEPTQDKVLVVKPGQKYRIYVSQGGEVDIATNVPPHLVKELKNNPKVTISSAPSVRTIFMPIYNVQCERAQGSWDCTKPIQSPVANPKVRQALAYATDKKQLVDLIFKGLASPAYAPSAPVSWAYSDRVTRYDYNPEKAKQLLKAAGQENLEFTILVNQGNKEREKAAQVQNTLNEERHTDLKDRLVRIETKLDTMNGHGHSDRT